jgi:hypothetical protein
MTVIRDFARTSLGLTKMGSILHAEVAAEDSVSAKGDAASADLDDLDDGRSVSITLHIVFRDFPIFAGRNAEAPPPADDGPACDRIVKIHFDSRARVMMTRATLKTRHDAARSAHREAKGRLVLSPLSEKNPHYNLKQSRSSSPSAGPAGISQGRVSEPCEQDVDGGDVTSDGA